MFSPGHLPGAIKTGRCMRNYIVIFFLENDTMENQESSANTEIPFDVTEITADNINMEDIIVTSTQQYWQDQSSDIAKKTISMNKSQITTLALNLLSTDSRIRSSGIHIPEMKPCILCKQKFTIHSDEPIKEFTMITCGCLYH